jgi:hypothetical protein
MKASDILPSYPLKYIEVRTNGPQAEDMLFGYCHWTGRSLCQKMVIATTLMRRFLSMNLVKKLIKLII